MDHSLLVKKKKADKERQVWVSNTAADILNKYAILGDRVKIDMAFRLLLSEDGPIYLLSTRKFQDGVERIDVMQDCCEWLLARILQWKRDGKTIYPGFLIAAIERWMFKYETKNRVSIFRADDPEEFEDGVEAVQKVLLKKNIIMAAGLLSQKDQETLSGCISANGPYDTGPNGAATRRRVLLKIAQKLEIGLNA